MAVCEAYEFERDWECVVVEGHGLLVPIIGSRAVIRTFRQIDQAQRYERSIIPVFSLRTLPGQPWLPHET